VALDPAQIGVKARGELLDGWQVPVRGGDLGQLGGGLLQRRDEYACLEGK
jgi:hypothetical protein